MLWKKVALNIIVRVRVTYEQGLHQKLNAVDIPVKHFNEMQYFWKNINDSNKAKKSKLNITLN